MFASILKRSSLFRPLISVQQPHFCSSVVNVNSVQRKDRLYEKIRLEIRGHDMAVISSYINFTKMAADNLSITFGEVENLFKNRPKKGSYLVERQICLRSAFVHKIHREQYEWRTYIQFVNFQYLTESTADTFLEYIERNLPEGCSMIVHKFEAIKMFDHLVPPVEEVENKAVSDVGQKTTSVNV